MIEINNATRTRVAEHLLKKIGRQVLAKEKKNGKDFSVALVGEKRMRELNKIYRGKNETTNVLSFPEKEFGLGEIVLCPAKIRKDSRKYGILFKQELVRVFTHGLLHILGYSHKQMKQR